MPEWPLRAQLRCMPYSFFLRHCSPTSTTAALASVAVAPRPSTSHVLSNPRTPPPTINPALVPSPRFGFAGALEPHMPASLSHKVPHILTPSGRAFSIGGRVQDVSSDPLYSCFLFWPDNEPLPELGQIRPSNIFCDPVRIVPLVVKLCLISRRHPQHPPILNTGNKGPIEHQPGDWVCKKCSYLNWRRRKVCQTWYPCEYFLFSLCAPLF
jgi:hypothetical protein